MAYLTIMSVLLAVLVYRGARRLPRRTFMKTLIGGLLGLDAAAAILAVFLLFLYSPPAWSQQVPAGAEAASAAPASNPVGLPEVGAGIAVGLAAIGAGIAVGITGAAAIGGMTEKPEILGRSLIFVGLAEGIAIYGLIISFMILTRHP